MPSVYIVQDSGVIFIFSRVFIEITTGCLEEMERNNIGQEESNMHIYSNFLFAKATAFLLSHFCIQKSSSEQAHTQPLINFLGNLTVTKRVNTAFSREKEEECHTAAALLPPPQGKVSGEKKNL